MEPEIVEVEPVGPSNRRYAPALAPQWRPPSPPPPLPPPHMTASSSMSAAEASASASAVTAALQFDSEKLPQTLVLEIWPFLRVANQIEAESPLVAYLCRFHAFEKAHMLDPRSTGRGVRQFKTVLLQRLEQDEKSTLSKRKERNDAREIKSFYEK